MWVSHLRSKDINRHLNESVENNKDNPLLSPAVFWITRDLAIKPEMKEKKRGKEKNKLTQKQIGLRVENWFHL